MAKQGNYLIILVLKFKIIHFQPRAKKFLLKFENLAMLNCFLGRFIKTETVIS